LLSFSSDLVSSDLVSSDVSLSSFSSGLASPVPSSVLGTNDTVSVPAVTDNSSPSLSVTSFVSPDLIVSFVPNLPSLSCVATLASDLSLFLIV